MRNINNKLRKNHRILSEQKFIEGKAKTTRNKLTSEGFDFDYFTSLKVYKNGAEYRFVYDIGYKLLEEDWILLVRKEWFIFEDNLFNEKTSTSRLFLFSFRYIF